MNRLKITIATALTALGTIFATGGEGQTAQPTLSNPEAASAELVFEQDGKTYAVAKGDIYEARGNGEWEFVDNLYDPDFFAKNYSVKDGEVFQRDPESERLYRVTRYFREDFEGAASVDDLLTLDRWHRYNTDPKHAGRKDNFYDLGNTITLSRDVVHSGNTSLRFRALPNSRDVSKAAVAKNIMYFKKGDDVYFSGWFFIEDTPSINDAGAFTIMDLESSFLRYVGMRVIFRRNDSLAFELKMPKTQFEQDRGSEVSFPTGQWVHVKTHIFLSDQDGLVEIWQDGRKVLEKRGQTLPLADTIYDNLELGITVMAKGSRYDKVLYVDDVVISDSRIDD